MTTEPNDPKPTKPRKMQPDLTNPPGPIQTKRINKAAGKLLGLAHTVRRLSGVSRPGGWSEAYVTPLMAMLGPSNEPGNPEPLRLYREVAGLHGWLVSKSNAKAVLTALEAAYPAALASVPTEDDRRTPEQDDERLAKLAESNKERNERSSKQAEALAAIMAKRPPNATALIIAELDESTSDLHTDYHGHTTSRVVAIGWRTGSRESFPQLRKAAAAFEHTAHLGPGLDVFRLWAWNADDQGPDVHRGSRQLWDFDATTEGQARERADQEIEQATQWGMFADQYGHRFTTESVEHRENYSMGAGNYLKAGGRDCSGWCVKSCTIGDDGTLSWAPGVIEDGLPVVPGVPDLTAGRDAPGTTEGNGYTITKAENRKGTFWLVVLAEQVDRATFDTLRASAKSDGGWYSRKRGKQPGGFGFTAESDAVTWAAHTFDEPDDPSRDIDDPADGDNPAEWLANLFEYENCAECGRGADSHTVVPDPIGNRFARCDSTPDDDAEYPPEWLCLCGEENVERSTCDCCGDPAPAWYRRGEDRPGLDIGNAGEQALYDFVADYRANIQTLHPDDGDGSNDDYGVYDEAVNVSLEGLRDLVFSFFGPGPVTGGGDDDEPEQPEPDDSTDDDDCAEVQPPQAEQPPEPDGGTAPAYDPKASHLHERKQEQYKDWTGPGDKPDPDPGRQCVVCNQPHPRVSEARPCCPECEKTAPSAVSAPGLFTQGPAALVARASERAIAEQPDPHQQAREREADRLEGLAVKMQADIDHKRSPLTQNPTPRRMRIKEGQRADADQLEQTQRALLAMAQAVRENRLPGALATACTMSRSGVHKTLHDFAQGRPVQDRRALLLSLIEQHTDAWTRGQDEERRRADELRELEDSVRFQKIPGFFPTPPKVVARVVELLQLDEPGLDILEPSAGIGHLAEPLRAYACESRAKGFGGKLSVLERQIILAEILERKNYGSDPEGATCLYVGDFLEHTHVYPNASYDRIAMNPPFERGQDVAHVQAALSLLRPGGRLVAVMTQRGAEQLDTALWPGFHRVEDLPAGSFAGADSFRTTGVSAVLYIATRDPLPSTTPDKDA